MDAAFQTAEALARCKDLREAAGIQVAFADRLVIQIGNQAQQFQELVSFLATDAAQATKVAVSKSLLSSSHFQEP